MKFRKPEMEVIKFVVDDVVTASGVGPVPFPPVSGT